jgi:putative membrane protein
MFVNYITLILTNLTAGLVLLAAYVYWGLGTAKQTFWVPGFAVIGTIALATGLPMIWTWPIIGSFNIVYGEPTVLFGVLCGGAAIALAMEWELLTLGLYAFFAGAYGIILGFRIYDLGLTVQPTLTAIGFVLTGLAGVCAAPTLYWRNNKALRLVGTVVLLIAALIWAMTDFGTLWAHVKNYSSWKPLTLR